MKKIFLIAALALAVMVPARAQTVSVTSTNLLTVLQLVGLSSQLANNQLVHVGVPFTMTTSAGQQTFLITTNTAGLYTITTSGANGDASFTPPSNLNDLLGNGTAWLSANNVANADYYGTNEINFKVGVQYLQNSGEVVSQVGVEFFWNKIGIGIGVLQGNKAGQSGTAGFYGDVLYRKVLGDVSVNGGLIFGYDKWNSAMFAGVKTGIEYRQSKHLGEFVDIFYVAEFDPKAGGLSNNDRGLGIGGGVMVTGL